MRKEINSVAAEWATETTATVPWRHWCWRQIEQDFSAVFSTFALSKHQQKIKKCLVFNLPLSQFLANSRYPKIWFLVATPPLDSQNKKRLGNNWRKIFGGSNYYLDEVQLCKSVDEVRTCANYWAWFCLLYYFYWSVLLWQNWWAPWPNDFHNLANQDVHKLGFGVVVQLFLLKKNPQFNY